jgi:hypothetical protein
MGLEDFAVEDLAGRLSPMSQRHLQQSGDMRFPIALSLAVAQHLCARNTKACDESGRRLAGPGYATVTRARQKHLEETMRLLAAWVVVLTTLAGTASAQSVTDFLKSVMANWTKPTEPFKVIDNIYYVGSHGLAST